MTNTSAVAACLAAVLWLEAGAALAQGAAIKCGRVYQDRPCANGGRVIAPTKAQKAVGTAHPLDPACQRRAADAQPIIDARQQGATQDQLLQEAGGDVSRIRLVNAVYQTSGSPDAQRDGLIAACMAERDALVQAHHAGAHPPTAVPSRPAAGKP
jgi:hypothetical protein